MEQQQVVVDPDQVLEIATLPPAERAKIALGASKAETQLRELIEKSAGITNVIDMAGREEAHRAGMTLKNARIAIEKTGKAAREDAQAFSNAVIAKEKRLKAITEAEEKRVFGLRDAFDAKVAAEKAEAERIERERVAGIRAKIDAIRNLPMGMHGEPSAEVETELNALYDFVPGEEFAEFAGEAIQARETAVAALRGMLEHVKAQEAEAARLAVERAELERLRAEAAERERQAAELRAAEEARARAEQEAQRQEFERRAEIERQAIAEQARIAKEAQEAAQAIIDAERAAFEAERRAFQEQQAAVARAEEERITRAEDEARQADIKAAAEMVEAEVETPTFGVNCTIQPAEEERKNLEASAALAVVTTEPSMNDNAPEGMATTEPDDAVAVEHFRNIVQELLITRTSDEIRLLVEEELAKFGLSVWVAA